jgi:hypothetical protein
MKTKNKTILPNYSAIASSDKYPIKNYEGENWRFSMKLVSRNCHFRSNLQSRFSK